MSNFYLKHYFFCHNQDNSCWFRPSALYWVSAAFVQTKVSVTKMQDKQVQKLLYSCSHWTFKAIILTFINDCNDICLASCGNACFYVTTILPSGMMKILELEEQSFQDSRKSRWDLLHEELKSNSALCWCLCQIAGWAARELEYC